MWQNKKGGGEIKHLSIETIQTEAERKSRAPEGGEELFPIISEASGLIYLNLNGDGTGA